MTRTRLALLVLALSAAAALGWWRFAPSSGGAGSDTRAAVGPIGGGPGGGVRRAGGAGADGPVPVLVARATREDVDLHVEGIGTVQADATVTVRAQVEGRLTELRFRDGQEVRAGEVLATIDPATYRAVHDQAVARRDQNEAELKNARADLERYERLAKSESGSRQQADTQRATVAKLEAQLRIDQGVIDAARIDLDNTTIRAPISGRTGIRTVDVGNLVRASDASGLVTIARLQPIVVSFTVPQQRLAALLSAEARGAVPVEVLDGEKRAVVDRGVVSVIDNLVDATTGTVRVKASLPNAERRLWPGQFVDVRVKVGVLEGALVVPSAAVQRSADGTFVFVLGEGDKAGRRAVAVTRQDDRRAVIASGLEPGDRVITTGFTRLTDGAVVKASEDGRPQAAGPGAGTGEGSGGGPRP